jgi:hypothetical protein
MPIALGGALAGSALVALLYMYGGEAPAYEAEKERATLVGRACMVKGEREAKGRRSALRDTPSQILGQCLYACSNLGGLYDKKGEEEACEVAVNKYFIENDMILTGASNDRD